VSWAAVMADVPCPNRNPFTAKLEAPVPPCATLKSLRRFSVSMRVEDAFSVAIRPSEILAVSMTVVDALTVPKRLSPETMLVFTLRESMLEDVAFRDPVILRLLSMVEEPRTKMPAEVFVGVSAFTPKASHAPLKPVTPESVPQYKLPCEVAFTSQFAAFKPTTPKCVVVTYTALNVVRSKVVVAFRAELNAFVNPAPDKESETERFVIVDEAAFTRMPADVLVGRITFTP